MAEWSKALAWKVSIRQNRIEGSNPSRSATNKALIYNDFPILGKPRETAPLCVLLRSAESVLPPSLAQAAWLAATAFRDFARHCAQVPTISMTSRLG